jgi:choline dehydrogenase-like flavoprotein
MMDRDLGGVVDSELRIYDTKNVRLVDASMLPFQIDGHLTSTLSSPARSTQSLSARRASSSVMQVNQ